MTMIADPSASATMRHAMVASQLRTNAVSDQRIVAAMAEVPREAFVPAESQAIAYRDTALPLGEGRWMNPPMATGRLLTEAYLEPTDRVLLIGAAGGYTAAVLSRIVTSVVAVEEDAALVALADNALADMPKVEIVAGPLNAGHADGGEVVQLYISDLFASVTPDVKRLRGFEKISLKPGETTRVSFEISARDVAFVAKDLSWTVEAGEYEVNIEELKSRFSITESKTFNQVKKIL